MLQNSNLYFYTCILFFLLSINYYLKKNKNKAVITFVASVISTAFYYSYKDKKLISNKKAKLMIKNNKIDYIIDVRTNEEWNLGHHPKAIHIPLSKLKTEIKKYPKKNKKYLLYCRTGRRARIGAKIMENLDFKNVYYTDKSYNQII